MKKFLILLLGVIALMSGLYLFFEEHVLAVTGIISKAVFSPLFWNKALIAIRLWAGKMSLRFVLVELPKKLFLPIFSIFLISSGNRKKLKSTAKKVKEKSVALKKVVITYLEKYFGKRTSLVIALVISGAVFAVFFVVFGAYMIVWTGRIAVPSFLSSAWRWIFSFIASLLGKIGFRTTIFVSVKAIWKKAVDPIIPAPARWWKKIRYRSARTAIRARQLLGIKSAAARRHLRMRVKNKKESSEIRDD